MGVRVKVGSGLMSYTLNLKLPCNEKRYHSEYILPVKSFEPQCEMADTRPQCYALLVKSFSILLRILLD